MDFKKQYLTYEEYKGLGGDIDQMPFNVLEFEARQNVDKYTFGRIKNLEIQNEEVKMCIFRLISLLESYQKSSGENVQSETIDGYSATYKDGKTKNNEIGQTIRDYLIDCQLEDGTPYLYRGV